MAFAIPIKWRDVFPEIDPLDRTRKRVVLFIIAFGFLTLTVPFFSVDMGQSERVYWTGLDIVSYEFGASTKPLPSLDSFVTRRNWQSGLFFVTAGYAMFAIYAIGVVFNRLRRLLGVASFLAFVTALGILRIVNYPLPRFLPKSAPASGLFAMLVVLILLMILGWGSFGTEKRPRKLHVEP